LDLRSFTLAELRERVARAGEPPFRAEQVFRWLHGPGAAAWAACAFRSRRRRFRGLCATLAGHAPLAPLVPTKRFESADGTQKFRFLTHDGRAIETVLIPDDKQERSKLTLCISSQAAAPGAAPSARPPPWASAAT
jgi:23S rRNA (adenine2503-C2)-methyltransferase